MKNDVEEYLSTKGPALSSDISTYLEKTLGISPSAARKRVSRGIISPVKRLSFLVFPHRSRFLYLERQFASQIYWSNLVDALYRTGSSYAHALSALNERSHVTLENHFPIICGAPLRQQKHLSPEVVFSRLNESGLLKKVSIAGLGECICQPAHELHYEASAPDTKNRLFTEAILLSAVSDWLKNLGIVSYEKVLIRNDEELPKVGTFAWDLTAPSYLGPLVSDRRGGAQNPGFVVCDVLYQHAISANGVRPFIHKCKTLRNLKNVGACLQIFVAKSYTKEAFQLLKANGIIPATPETLFGVEVATSLTELSGILTKASQKQVFDSPKLSEIISSIQSYKGASLQLRGTLFEYISADLLRKTFRHNSIRMNYICKIGDKSKESDIVVDDSGRSVTFVECKAHSVFGKTADDEVRYWLHQQVPHFYRYASNHHSDWMNCKYHFEFWSTAPLEERTIKMLEQAKSDLVKYTIDWKTNHDVLALCKDTKDQGLITAYTKHFTVV